MPNGYDRWCPTCGVWVKPDDLRVRENSGLKRHTTCETVTSPTKTTAGEHVVLPPDGSGKGARKCTCEKGWDHFDPPSELQEAAVELEREEPLFESGTVNGVPLTPDQLAEVNSLAARMAADEANEGNYAAAAELADFAEGRSNGLLYRGDPDAPTGPLTPGQVICRVCQLDDRTRAASCPDDELCTVCREDTPNRIRNERLVALRVAAARFLGFEDVDDTTAAGSAEMDLIQERIDALMRLAELVDGHSLPYSLVNAAELGVREMEALAHPPRLVTDGRESDADAARRFAGQCFELQKRVELLEANERNRQFVAKSLDRLKPQLAHRVAQMILPSLDVSEDEVRGWSQSQIDEWAAIHRAAREAAERLVEAGLRFVPTDDEIEAAVAQLCYTIAGPDNIPGTPLKMAADWDSKLYLELSNELREALNQCRESGYEDWGIFGLVRVSDETVFGQETDRG